MAKTEKEKAPKVPVDIFGNDFKRANLPEGKSTSLINQADIGVKSSDFEDYGNIHVGEDINKIREQNQSFGEQAGSFLTQSAGEIVGGAISGIGATLDIPDAVISEMNDKDADFKNVITEAGDAITQYTKDAAPIYRKNPGKSFDVTDSGWWFENGTSVASTLSLLIPSMGAVKGISYVSKMLGLADELALAGKITSNAQRASRIAGGLEKAKYFGKIAVGAAVSRNAENFKESLGILTDTKDNLLKEWNENPDKYNELLKSDVAKELADEGREVNQENLSNFIASKAAWLSYGVNSLNIAFDAMQLTPLFKGFKPTTQLSKLETSAAIKAAQKAATGQKFTRFDKIYTALNPLSSSIARNATEGVEEAINYVGGEEGKNYADQLTGKKTKDLADRIKGYAVDPKMYESAVWGILGGIAFGGAVNGLGKIANLVKGKDGYGLEQARVDEINSRVSQMATTAEQVKSVQEDKDLTDEEKEKAIGNIKNSLVTNLSIKAAQVGNFDMLMEHLSSPEMKKQMIESGYATEEDVDKAVANSLSDAQIAVDLYKSNYNLFQTRNIDENTKIIQVAEKTYWDAVNSKAIEQKNRLGKEIEILKAKDSYVNSTHDKNVNATIQLEALKIAKKTVDSLSKSDKNDRNAPVLTQYQQEILTNVDKKISELEDSINEKASLNNLNPNIIQKQAEMEIKNMYIDALGHKVNYIATPQYSNVIKEDIGKAKQDIVEKDDKEFEQSLQGKSKEELEGIKSTINSKRTPNKIKTVDAYIKEATKKEEQAKRKESVQQAKEKVEPILTKEEKPSPVKDVPTHEIFDFFDEDFKKHNVKADKLDPKKKSDIDKYFRNEDWNSLIQIIYSAEQGTLEGKYAENLISKFKEDLVSEVKDNKEVSLLNEFSKESDFDLSEENLHNLEHGKTANVINKKDNNGLLFAKETDAENGGKDTIKPLIDVLKLKDFSGNDQFIKDKNGNLITTKENEKATKAVFDLKVNDELTLKIDPTNSLYERYKEDSFEVPIGVYTKDGIRIGYIMSRKRSLNTEEFNFITDIREKIGTDLTKTFKAKVSEKTYGDVINTNEFYSIDDMTLDNYEFYAVPTGAANNNTLERLSPELAIHRNPEHPYGRFINTPYGKTNLRGVVYLMLHNANGKPFPTPLAVSKLSVKDAKEVENKINKLLAVLDSGVSLGNEAVTRLKDEIAEYILVDDSRDIQREQAVLDAKRSKFLEFEKATTEEGKLKYEELKAEHRELENRRKISFRVYARTKNKPSRIEMTYIADDGSKRLVILNKDKMSLRDSTGKYLTERIRNAEGSYGKMFANQVEENALTEILKRKYYSIDFKKLKAGDTAYKNRIIKDGLLRTNVGELRDTKNNVLGNFTNFGIKFTNAVKEITTPITETQKEEKKEKLNNETNKDLFDTLFESQRDYQTKDKLEENNYSLYRRKISTSKEILDEIIKNAKTPAIKAAAETLKSSKNNVQIGFKSIDRKTTTAVYDPIANIINVNTNFNFVSEQLFQESVLHELVHAATLLPLLKYQLSKIKENKLDFNNVLFKSGTPQHIINFVNEMEAHRQKAIVVINRKFPEGIERTIAKTYGITNVYEFISEVFTNSEFREAIDEAGERNFFEKILDSIMKFLNTYLGADFAISENEQAIRAITNFIKREKAESYKELEEGIVTILDGEYAGFRKESDIRDIFSNEEKNHLLNFTNNAALQYFKKIEDKDTLGEKSVRDFDSSKEFVHSKFKVILDKAILNDSQKELLTRADNNFDVLWKATLTNLNRIFRTGIDLEEDLNIEESQELQKDWDDSIVNSVSLNEQLSKEIKWFIATTPAFEKDGARKINAVTGLPEVVNYFEVINLMVKHLSTAQTELELLRKLENLKAVNYSYGVMAKNLKDDVNLLALFKSNFTRNIVNSNILLISKIEEYVKVKVENELKKTQGYISIANKWIKNISSNIETDTYNSEGFKQTIADIHKSLSPFEDKQLQENYLSLDNKLTNKGEELSHILFQYSNALGVTDLSYPAIEDSIKASRTVRDVIILNRLNAIYNNIKKGQDNYQNLNEIAKFQETYDLEFAEIMALNIKGEPVYAAQLPSFITNFFARLKTTDKTIKEKFENDFKQTLSNDPSMQYSNWAFTERDTDGKVVSLGLFEYEKDANGKKVPTELNADYLSIWGIAKLGGSKNTVTKDAQVYSEMDGATYDATMAFMYLDQSSKINEKGHNYCYVPTLIPSDSGTFFMMKVPRIALKKKDFIIDRNESGDMVNVRLLESSNLYRAVRNVTFQEIERIKQAYNYVFDVTSEDLRLKTNLYNEETEQLTEEGKVWLSTLIKNFHYKEIVYKKDTNEVDVKATLITNGKPTGKAFQFHNLRIERNGKNVTLSNVEGFDKFYQEVGRMDRTFIKNNIDSFVRDYINQVVKEEIKHYRPIQEAGIFKGEHYSYIGDGSLEAYVTEMALNQYVGYAEQQIWFNGVTAEYKNSIDTSKRAKQMFAPGNSPSDAGASSYRAITIQDIKLKSATYDYIVQNVKDNLIREKSYKYSKETIASFNPVNISSIVNESTLVNELEKDIYKITKDYLKINSGDAQGYITVAGLKELYEKYGMMNDTMIAIFKQIESGKQLTSEAIRTLQAAKPFSYGRNYNEALGMLVSNQIKLSYLPLIPQLIAGTDLEKLNQHLETEKATRVFFESAHKVGASQIYKIHNEDGRLNENYLKSTKAVDYVYSDEQIQLTVPDHLVDNKQLLATQIAKIIIANLSNNPIYDLHGTKVSGKELKDKYFKTLIANIEESKDKLLKDIKVSVNEDGEYVFESNEALRELLLEEIANRGLGKNFEDAIKLKDNGEFVLPLFTGKNAEKWESILTSLFTNRIMKQKMPGASLVLASDLFTQGALQEDAEITGIEWSKDKTDKVLRSYREEDGKVQVVEVIMGAWSKKFFKEGKRVSIDDIPENIKTMIGYRIPTQAKHSMVVFKVVGFLPEESKGTIIMPNDIITQMGSDFDIDKLFVMYKNFVETADGYSTDIIEANASIKRLEKRLRGLEKTEELDEAATKLVNDIFKKYDDSFEPIPTQKEYVVEKLSGLIKKLERQERENELIDIYTSILTNPYHLKESFTPATFEDLVKGKEILNELFEESDDKIDVLSPNGQRTFRNRNMAGRVLKGIAANFNSFLSVAQVSGMTISSESSYIQKCRVKGEPINDQEKIYDLSYLQKNYSEITIDGEYAIVSLNSFTKEFNVEGNLTTEVASQGIGAAVDNAKDPVFESFNATTYTYPQFNTGLSLGSSPKYMMFFTRQPIIKMLNDEYFNNKSLLGDSTGEDRQKVREVYETLLYNNLIKQKKIKGKLVDLKGRKYKTFKKEQRKELFGYDLDSTGAFSEGELYHFLKQYKKGRTNLSLEEQEEYLKNQLLVLNMFNRYKKTGDAVQDILKAVKTDGTGAGPSLEKTADLLTLINRSNSAKLVKIGDKSAVEAIYPKLFDSQEPSAYPTAESYLDNVNILSYKILSNLFITQNPSFKNAKRNLSGFGVKFSDNNKKVFRKFFNKVMLQEFITFDQSHSNRVLGTSIYRENRPTFDGTIESFRELSTQDKLAVIKELSTSEIVKGQYNIINRLTPNTQFDKTGISGIDFDTNYKDSNLDDLFAEQLENLYFSGNEFTKEFVIDLMRYNYFANGMEFGYNSITKVFPPSILVNENVGEHLYSKSKDYFTLDFDKFFRNNWQNKEIVPFVKTKFQMKDGKKQLATDDEGVEIENQYLTNGNTPVWDFNQEILTISQKQLANEDRNIQNSPYLRLVKFTKSKEDGSKYIETPYLYKKVVPEIQVWQTSAYDIVEVSDLLDTRKYRKLSVEPTPEGEFKIEVEDLKTKDKTIIITGESFSVTPVPNSVYYYRVNPLGKNGIIELTDNSIWLENRLIDEDTIYQNLINKIESLDINNKGFYKTNVPQNTIDKHNENCNGL